MTKQTNVHILTEVERWKYVNEIDVERRRYINVLNASRNQGWILFCEMKNLVSNS
jgi:hypothetical protein